MSRKTLILSVRDFALPVPRVGSIETHSGYGPAPVEGQALHLKIQSQRAAQHPNYRSEVFLRHDLERNGYKFQVSGRMDGLFEASPPDPPHVEEIKSAFQIDDLARKLEHGADTHPYCLQLRTYGYFYYLKSSLEPRLTLHLVSTRNGFSRDLELALDPKGYEAWLDRRLDELVEEAKAFETRAKRRKKAAKNFVFPFTDPRPGQVELIKFVEDGMKAGRRLWLQAPTGLGKTVGVLYPTLKEALARGQNVLYVTPKNSQHSVAEDAMARFQETGAKVRSLTLTAKSKICFKPEPICNPEYCEFAKDHYTKVEQSDLKKQLQKKKRLTARSFRQAGEEHVVCPFELQLELARDADTVICDYNYVFSPRSAVGRLAGTTLGQEGNPNLVVDEAHNLVSRSLDYYSPAISTLVLENFRGSIRQLKAPYSYDVERLLDAGIDVVNECRPPVLGTDTRIEPPVEAFVDHQQALQSVLTRYLESDAEIQPRDPVLKLFHYWTEFTAMLEYVTEGARPEFFTSFQQLQRGAAVRITCCDASQELRACYDEFRQVVGFSATLKPFEYYAKLSGLDAETLETAEFSSPFPRAHRKLLIIPQLSTRYTDRPRNAPRIADAIRRIVTLRPGNYFAFFPSFEFLERVRGAFDPPEGFTVVRQEREMNAAAVQTIVDKLREAAEPTVVFAVQGGVFSEGVDYPGRAIIGAFIVGPPLPNFDREREQMRQYYDEHYGAGFEYAYTYPAMAKAVQAAGRVIRSETDRGIIVLMDNRFLQPTYTQSMPTDWFDQAPQELVSSAILKEISDFWSDEGCGKI